MASYTTRTILDHMFSCKPITLNKFDFELEGYDKYEICEIILKKYFNYVKMAVIFGYVWHFPMDFGKMYIYKMKLKHEDIDKYLKNRNKRTNKRMPYYTNRKFLGHYFRIIFEGYGINPRGYTYKSLKPMRSKLARLLIKTDLGYEYEEESLAKKRYPAVPRGCRRS